MNHCLQPIQSAQQIGNSSIKSEKIPLGVEYSVYPSKIAHNWTKMIDEVGKRTTPKSYRRK
jgi:hypothetical protein